MTDGAKPATRKSLAKEEVLKSFLVVADGWAGAEQNEDETAVPVVRMPETKPAKAELLTPAQIGEHRAPAAACCCQRRVPCAGP